MSTPLKMLDISGHGATVAGHPINGVDLRLVDEWSHCGVTTTEDVAMAAHRLHGHGTTFVQLWSPGPPRPGLWSREASA